MSAENKPAPMKHIDDWLDDVRMPGQITEGEAYARWWLELARFPAWKQMLYRPIMTENRMVLFCTYEGERYRVTGASRLGDVWLTSQFSQRDGYEHRVDVAKCTDWGREP